MRLTPSQIAAVEHRGSNLLVSASAGSGKTEVLARRCVSLLVDPQQPCGIDRLLVVTFTRAAAAELRVRVARMLREHAADTGDADLRRHLRRQELLVESADIGTIDAWCNRIVREHFAEAGVDAQFAVLDEQDALLLRRAVLDELFDHVHRGDLGSVAAGASPADEARAWIARAATPSDDFLRTLVSRLNLFREHLVKPAAWFAAQRAATADAADAERVLATALMEECGFQREQLTGLLGACGDAGGAGVPPAIDIVRPYADRLAAWRQRLAAPGALPSVVDEIGQFKIPKPAKRGTAEPPEVVEVRDRWLKKRLQETWAAGDAAGILKHAPATAALAATLLRLEDRYQEMLADAKRRQAGYEFGDVLRLALDLVGRPAAGHRLEPTAIARRLQQRYDHILVDEYQDTSPVQVEILRLVTRDAPGRTNRFMVGDVKQSIYGFRQAEPRLFSELIDAFTTGGEEGRVRYLADNFRSHADLLRALNELFARLFDPALGGTPFGVDERLQARRDEIANPTLAGQPRVAVHVIDEPARRPAAGADEPEELTVERIQREAQLAADEINRLLRAGVQVPQRGPDDRLTLRSLRLSDVVVLLRSAKQNAGLVARVLRDNGIRCAAGGRESLLDAPEVRDVCNVLRLLVNRRQDVPLAAYLRGPLVGLAPAELLSIRTAAGEARGDFYAAVEHYAQSGPDALLAAKVRAALAQLDGWSAAARDEELPEVLRRIVHEGDLAPFAAGLPAGEQRVALLRALQNLAVGFAARAPGGAAEFVAYLEALAEEEIDPGALAAGDEDALRVMTIHGAKGLEFPVLFLLAAGAAFNRRRQADALQCDADLGCGLKFADYAARAELTSARQHVIRRRLAERELEEELRLLYVAATRARERLYVVGHAPAGAWDECVARYAARHTPPPLISRLSVRNRLEWVLMATAAGGLHLATGGQPALVQVSRHTPQDIRVAEPGAAKAAPPAAPPATPEDDAWVDRGRTLLDAPVDRTLANLPAVLSVSAAKELALRDHADDRPHLLDAPALRLPAPAFAAGTTPDGRDVGAACHRFLQFADFARLTTVAQVQTQVAELVAAGRLSGDEAKLVPAADLAWLGTTREGKLLAENAGRARREVPFVYAFPLTAGGEHTIVRGVIDCLLDLPDGLLILDYKTDAPRSDDDFAARLAGYTVQLQLYARAAGAIFARPAVRAALIFLRARRIANVPLATPALDALLRA